MQVLLLTIGFLDPAKFFFFDTNNILDNIHLNEALSTSLLSYLVSRKYLVSMLEQAPIPGLSAVANRVGMMNPFNKA